MLKKSYHKLAAIIHNSLNNIVREFSLLDSFTLTSRQRTYLISDYEQNEKLDLLFAKAEAFFAINYSHYKP